MATTAYRALPFPLCNLPDPQEDVTLVDLRDAALPRLQRAHCTLRALSLAAARDTVQVEDLASTLAVLAGHVEVCRDQIDRAPHSELRDAALPKLRSAHCQLDALSLAAARDTIQVEELPHALDDLAEKVEACRDLIDRTTHDR